MKVFPAEPLETDGNFPLNLLFIWKVSLQFLQRGEWVSFRVSSYKNKFVILYICFLLLCNELSEI